MLTLHHLEYSQSFRVLWLLEELGIDYELKKYNRDSQTRLAPDNYKAISPLGTAPVLEDGELRLAETNAIIDYIIDQHPASDINPASQSPDRSRHLFWYHAAQGSMMPILMFDSLMRIASQRMPAPLRLLVKPVFNKMREGFSAPRMRALLARAEQDLATQPWFGGENLSTADIAMSYPMESANARGFIDSDLPHCQAWLKQVYQRPAFISAKEKDGRECMVLPL